MDAVTTDDVLEWGDVNRELSPAELDALELVITVVTDMVVNACVPLDEDEPDAGQEATMRLAIIMQSLRLFKRRETPEGITAVFDGVAAMRVTGYDPDIKALIWSHVSWGVA